MQTLTTELSDVIYNPAAQAFEARVTLHTDSGAQSYACAIEAPITTSFEDAAEGLAKQALRKHGAPRGLRSWVEPRAISLAVKRHASQLRRGLPLGQYGFFRGRAA